MKWVLLCAAAALLGWLWWMGTLAELSDPDRLRVMVDDAGAAGPLAFVGLVPTMVFGYLISLLTCPPSDDQIAGLTSWTRRRE